MMRKYDSKFVVALLILTLSTAAIGATQFVKPDAVDFKSILTTAPSEDSETTKQEIQQILALQEKRTPEEVKRAQSEVMLTVFAFSDVLGSWFNPDDLPITSKLLIEVGKETKAISSPAKDFYGRRRPPLVDARIKPCVEMEKSASYPSGHSTRATVWATILGEMFPEKKEALMARAKQIGDDRVLGGMHFPSDVEAGRVLGAAIAQKFLDDPEFKAELEKAKDECMADVKRK